MKIVTTTKNVKMSGALENRIEHQVHKSDRYLADDQVVRIVLEVKNNGLRHKAEITVPNGKSTVRVEAVSTDMYTAIDEAADKLSRMLKRKKEKNITKRKGASSIKAGMKPETADEIVNDSTVAKEKDIKVEYMTIEEAIEAMELTSHSFYVFTDKENVPKIVYKRYDDTYGLLNVVSE